jgi:hypothetical protein
MHNTTKKTEKKMVITWRDTKSAGGPVKVSHRCGPWGGKGKNNRTEKNRKAVAEQY